MSKFLLSRCELFLLLFLYYLTLCRNLNPTAIRTKCCLILITIIVYRKNIRGINFCLNNRLLYYLTLYPSINSAAIRTTCCLTLITNIVYKNNTKHIQFHLDKRSFLENRFVPKILLLVVPINFTIFLYYLTLFLSFTPTVTHTKCCSTRIIIIVYKKSI